MRISDWSSDVCSSDLEGRDSRQLLRLERALLDRGHVVAERLLVAVGLSGRPVEAAAQRRERSRGELGMRDRRGVVEGKSVSVSVEHGGRGIINKKRKK